ncbi:MAG: hypothetical protein M3Q03_10840 [Chloroflexota bacterium]|nr:hypothetical protein [Chloroflexota bacterium]
MPDAEPTTLPQEVTTLPFSAEDLGFVPIGNEGSAWRATVGGQRMLFCLLSRVGDLTPVEDLQRTVFGVTDLDVIPASELVVVPETGGAVIGVFPDGAGTDAVPLGAAVAWGGFVEGRPRLVSDLLAVRAEGRGAGVGTALKRLQAAVALERGVAEVVWTVDPLRAANARLNFEKLGAHADRYEEDRYGAGFGAGLYGGLPTDRLHVIWPLTSLHVRDRLLGRTIPRTLVDVAGLPVVESAGPLPEASRALVHLPGDIDALLATDPEAAAHWRFALRETLQRAFAAGFAIVGFVAGAGPDGLGAYVIEHRTADRQPQADRE